MTSLERQIVKDRTKRHEGFRAKPYRCSSGILTIGWGTNIDDGIDREEAEYLLEHRLFLAVQDLAGFRWFESLSPVRQRALIDVRYQLGPSRFRGFVNMLAALERGDMDAAADELLDSKLGKLDAPARTKENAALLRHGRAA